MPGSLVGDEHIQKLRDVEPIVNAANIAGLILVIVLLIFRIMAVTDPDKVFAGADRSLHLGMAPTRRSIHGKETR